MADDKKGRKRKFESDVKPPEEGRRLRSHSASAAITLPQRSTPFPSLGQVPHHDLDISRKRAKSSAIGGAQGDRRVVEDHVSQFKERKLKGAPKNHFVKKFEEANTKRGSFLSHQTISKKDGSKAHEYFGIVEPVKGSLTGRTVDTPLSSGFLPGIDNSSHPLPLSAVRNQHEVNKSSVVFSENAIANQGGARHIEEVARDKANELGDKRVALVTRTATEPGSDRPVHVARHVLVRSDSGNNVSLLGGFSHDNDKKK